MRGALEVSRTALIAFCGLLLSVSAFSCDITLPAFWSMQQDLGAPIEWVQAVVPVFLIFQATGQLIFAISSFALTAVPEVSPGGLCAAGGLAALVLKRRRRFKQAGGGAV